MIILGKKSHSIQCPDPTC